MGGVLYPIPSFLRYQAVFPEKYMKLEDLWQQEGPQGHTP
jgi:hypothetical protein